MTMPETTQSDLVEREEMQVSAREHPGVSEDVLREAIKLARQRGGQTIPVSDYDILRARDMIAGEQSEVTRLTAELHAAKMRVARLRAHCEAMAKALSDLEKANEELCAVRSVRTYHSIIQDGAEELLLSLDNARKVARENVAAYRKENPDV